MDVIDKNKDKISSLCGKYGVERLFVFGSALTNSLTDASDIDFLVNFKGVDLYEYADNYFNLKSALEELFNRPVDLLEDNAIKNPYLRKSIDSSKRLVYG